MRFGVDTIEAVAGRKTGPGQRLGNTFAASWRKYKELMGETSGAAEANIEAEILRGGGICRRKARGRNASRGKDSLSQSQRGRRKFIRPGTGRAGVAAGLPPEQAGPEGCDRPFGRAIRTAFRGE